ncbi:MAG: gliding motility protein GldM [Bacteroidaceae bacterium]|nr:gliding motility protein GldM [Bacteroidaceae bacterium]
MAVKKRPVSPRQKMINLMYIVLLAMLALNVSNDVLKGFILVGDSLERTIDNIMKENQAIYDDLDAQLKANEVKVRPWYNKAQYVKRMSDSLYNYAENLRWAIAREADGRDGNPSDLRNKEHLDAAGRVMLAPVRGEGRKLYDAINHYRERITQLVNDPRQQAIIAANLSTDVPKGKDNLGKNWEQYMFEKMPSVAAVTMLSKLQSDIRSAEGEVLHTLVSNIDMKDIRVNELNAYVLPEATTLFPGDMFKSNIFMAAVDTTQRPEIYVNGQRISANGDYSFRVGSPGEYSFTGHILMPNASGEIIRREFIQKYNVIAPPAGATVAADLMNVLYAGFENPVSVSASGIPTNKIRVTMEGGTLTSTGVGKYVARPTAVGQDVIFSVTGELNGKMQSMGNFTFKVRKLPDPTPYITVGTDRFKGGRLAKGSILGATGIGAAIDDGLLDIPFRVLGFETVFFDRMGNARPEASNGANFTDSQRELMRSLRRGQRFYISSVRAIGPDGIERKLNGSLEIIVN